MLRRWFKRLQFLALVLLPLVLGLSVASCFYQFNIRFCLGRHYVVGMHNGYFFAETARIWELRRTPRDTFEWVPANPRYDCHEFSVRAHNDPLPVEFPKILWRPGGRAYEISGRTDTRTTGSLWVSAVYPLTLLALLGIPLLLTRRRPKPAAFPVTPATSPPAATP